MAKKIDWTAHLLKNKQGAYLPCLNNAIAILTHREEWHNVITYDAFAGNVVKKKPPPWCEDTTPEDDSLGDWEREDSMRTVVWITREYGCPIPTHIVDEAVQVVAKLWVSHPIRDYVNECARAWDKKPRIDDLLIRVAGAPDTPYVRAVTKNFFIGAVARIMKPGVQVDTVLILEGAQGLGKSTLFRILASDDWFMDTMFNLGSKDGYQALRRKWIVEFSELDALGRAELSRVKAFISSVKDTYRQSYGRQAVDFLRQCVFAGTVNPGSGYLNDPTGARRFWPVTLTRHVDLKTVKAERDQLWGEAISRYRRNEPWHLRDPKLLKAAAEETEARRENHPWEAHFRDWLNEHPKYFEQGITTERLLTKAVGMRKDQQGRSSQIDAGKTLRAIGWTVTRRGSDDVRRYFPAEKTLEVYKRATSNPPNENISSRGPSKKRKGKRG